MFSIFRFRQGCLYFHSYSNVWVSLVLLKGLILSALEGAIITRQRGRQCGKEIAQHNFPPPSPNVSLFRMTQINFKPSCPLHFHSEELREGKKKNKNKTRQTLRRDYSDYSGRNIAHLYPWLHRSLSLGSEYSDTVVLGQWGRKQSWFLLFQLIARAEALWWCCTDVQHLACSQGKIKVLAVQEKSKRAKLSS